MTCTKGKFSLFEKIWMQLSFNGMWILGAIAILHYSLFMAIFYIILFPVIGILFFVMHSWICPRCPHLKKHSSCSQLPVFLVKKIIKKDVSGSMKLYEKIGFFVVIYGTFIFPLYWISNLLMLFIPFVIFGLMHYGAFFVFCRKCLNVSCPQNMNKNIL